MGYRKRLCLFMRKRDENSINMFLILVKITGDIDFILVFFCLMQT